MNYLDILNAVLTVEKKCEAVDNIQKRLRSIFDAYLSCITKSSLRSEYSELEEICDTIIQVVKLSEDGRSNMAQEKLYQLYFCGDGLERLRTVDIKEGISLYKMREAETYTQYTKETHNEMYHVPFEFRYKIRGARYSVVGLPVFYLSESVYGCWEEIKRKSLDYSNVALFKPTKTLKFVDMTLPNANHTINEKRVKALPLILASRLKVRHPDSANPPEYIIPQLVMNCVIQTRGNIYAGKNTLVGVRYESIHNNERDLLFTNRQRRNVFVNYAIPPFESKDSGICPVIKSLFRFRANTSWAEIHYTKPKFILSIDTSSSYNGSVFGLIEEKLCMLSSEMLTYNNPIGALTTLLDLPTEI